MLIIFISKLLRSSIQRELNDFYGKIIKDEFSIQEVSASAFTQARAKLKHEAFIELNKETVKQFYKTAPYLRWGEFRVLGGDGSTLMVPNSKDIERHYPKNGFGPKADAQRSMAKISLLYDVFNNVTLDAQIEDFKVHETTLLKKHLDSDLLMENDLLVLDRGYGSIGLFYELTQRKINFCVRLKSDWWLPVKAMREEGITDKVITLTLPKKDRKLAEHFNTNCLTVEVRIVFLKLDNGSIEVLATSLLDPVATPIEDLKWLYGQRWNEEEAYKLLKCRVDVERFSGLTALSVKQDFYASIFTMNLTAVLCFPVEQKIAKEGKQKRKRDRKINKTNALSFVSKSFVGIFIHNLVEKFLNRLDKFLETTTNVIRPNRKFNRSHRPKKPKANTYKAL